MRNLVKLCGISTLFGGVFFILTNTILTPLIDFDAPIYITAQTSIFLYRMISAAIGVSFLLFGIIGLHLYQIKKSNIFGNIAFVFALFGTAFTLANEWYQIFVTPELAVINPEALASLESSSSVSLYNFGTMMALSTFSIGWILYSISMLTCRVYAPIGPILIISGFLLLPILSFITTPFWGGVLGTLVMGLAFCLLGRELLLSKKEASEFS